MNGSYIGNIIVIAIGSSLISNVVLSQFLGLCPFLGVSKKVKTAAGMGGALIFVITLSSLVAGLIYKFILRPLNIEYLKTIVFILIIAALVQFVEFFLKKYIKSLYQALGVYLPLITTALPQLQDLQSRLSSLQDFVKRWNTTMYPNI